MAERGVSAHWYLPPPGVPNRPGEVLPFGRVDLFNPVPFAYETKRGEISDHREPVATVTTGFLSAKQAGMFHKDSSKR
jgi:hypothetical protein